MDKIALHLNADYLNVIHWWFDASYGTHPDLKGHRGATVSIGEGSVTSMSKKQRFNTTSSTISELMGVYESSPQVLWTKSFLRNQGFHVNEATLYQDNQSAMLLEGNGHASSSGCPNHINIRYFFIRDQIYSGNVKVGYCPTEEMVADFFTEPLQGRKFREFIGRIMGLPPEQEWVKVPSKPRIRAKEGAGPTADATKHVSLNSRPAGVCWDSNNRFMAFRET